MFTIKAYGKKILVNDGGKPIFPSLLPDPMKNIVQFDLDRLRDICNRNQTRIPTEINSLALGCWTNAGKYIQPIDEMREVSERHEE